MKKFWGWVNKFYLANASLAAALILSVVMMFLVQFKVESLQEEVLKTEEEIVVFKDEIRLLEVEWVYLTRPERLRNLAARFLQDNSYALASQIKDTKQLEQYYLVNYKKSEDQDLVFAAKIEESQRVSF
jgi:hypothetical protein